MPVQHLRRLVAVPLAATIVLGSAVLGLTAQAAVPTMPFVSEIHYDNAGADVGEFVEVQLPPGTSSGGLSVVLYNGTGGVTYGTPLALPTVTAPAGAPAVVSVAAVGLQNGSPDGLALVSGTTVLDRIAYEGSFAATNGPASGQTLPDIGVAEAGTEPVGQSLSRQYDAATDSYVWQGPATATHGTLNPPLAPPPPVTTCDQKPTHEIGAVQGSGRSTLIATGQPVTVRGVVVGDVPGLGGFYLQDTNGDGDLATSDGIFVDSSVPVGLGDIVAVTGPASEDFGQTQIVAGRTVGICAVGSPSDLPAAVALDLPATDAAREPFEGMRVSPADRLTVSEVFELTRYGELTLSEGGLLVTPTEVARPGPAAEAVAANNALRTVVLDDGTDVGTTVTNRPYLSATTPVRVGDTLTFTAPTVLGFAYGDWRLQPADGTAEGTVALTNTRPAAPAKVGGDVQVAAFNVLNYFLTLTGPDARGARSPEQFEKQAGKIVPAIEALDAAVVTLMEIEDTASTGYGDGSPDQALADLVRRLNDAAGYHKWSYVPLPQELLAVDRDVIRNAIIYHNDVVQPIGDPVGLVDESVWFNAREPIAQTFSSDGDRFTVVANHFKSKSPGAPTGDNVDTGDGQGAWNGDRQRQAASLVTFARDLRVRTGEADVLLIGDFNAYTQEDPIQVLRDAAYTDLGERFDPRRYSYVFDAASGSLDHALASPSLLQKVTELTHWNINAVESFAYQYYGDPALYAANPYRSSDHDPLVLGISLQERCNGLRPTIRGTNGRDFLRGTKGRDVIMGLGGNDVIDGLKGDDVICGGAGADTIYGGKGNDTLLGGFGNDTVSGGKGDDRLVGGPGRDRLWQDRGRGPVIQEGPES